MKAQMKFRLFSIISILSILISAVNVSTAAAADQTPFMFASMSDAHVEGAFATTLSQVASLNPQLVIFNGDLENDGVVAPEIGPMVDNIRTAGLYNRTFLVRGNHDNVVPGSAALWESYFEAIPKTLPTGLTDFVAMDASSTYLNYSYIYRNSMFISLDVPGDADLLTTDQIDWLDSRLTYAESQDLTHAFVNFHGPMYCVDSSHCTCTNRTDAGCTPSALIPVINNHPIISAFLQGHNHVESWTHMDHSRLSGLSGTASFEQFITSPAGATNYASAVLPNRVDYYDNTSPETRGFATISVDGSSFTYRVYEDGTSTPVWSKTFTKGVSPTTPPTVTTQDVTAIAGTTATGHGTITTLGLPTATQYGVVWDTAANPTIALPTKTQQGAPSGGGPFTSSITGLAGNTLYHVRAYVTNTVGTAYGQDVTFTTLNLPTVTTEAVTNIMQSSATGNGTITSLGNPNPTQHGVCWGTSSNPTISNSHTSEGPVDATGAFTSTMAGLVPGTLYHVRAYATNAGGTAYGSDVQFTTSAAGVVTFTTAGPGSWAAPDSVTSVIVEVWGGGGRGASITSGSGEEDGGGGGGGAYSRSVVAVTPGTSYDYVVGAGSTGTTPGGDSYFINASTVMAKGGDSAGNNSSSGADGGRSSSGVGSNRYSGGDGYSGSTFSNRGGGGGSSAGTSSNGDDGDRENGGDAPAGGGDGGDGRSGGSSGNGSAGVVPGGAGGGAYRSSGSSTYTGGAGANGQVRITYYAAITATSTSLNCGAGIPAVTIGGSITCVATVAAASGTISPSGIVSWTTNGDGSFATSPCTLSGTGGSATCQVDYTPASIGTGLHLITADYSGDPSFVDSSGNQNVRVAPTSFSFAAIGDAQPVADFQATVTELASHNPALVLFSGNLEENGVTTAEMDPMTAALKNADLYNQTFLVRGNHDNDVTGSAALWENYFEDDPPTRPAGVANYVPIDSNSTYLTYSFIYGNSMFVGLDVPQEIDSLTTAQLNWLDARLTYAESQALTHAFIFFHSPMYCVESNHCTCSTRTNGNCTPAALITVINRHPIISAFIPSGERVLGWTHLDNTRLTSLTGKFEQFLATPAGGTNYSSYVYPERMDYYLDEAQPHTDGFATISVNGPLFTYSIYKNGTSTPVWSRMFYKGTPVAPAVTTQAVTSVGVTTATGNGTVTDPGLPYASQHGVVWSTSPNPTTADSKTAEGLVGAAGAFTSSITGLTPGTQYHVRAYATNDAGTVYGDDVTFTTYLPVTLTTLATNARTGTNVTGIGTVNWTNPGYITADDSSFATVALASTTSRYLEGTNYGFAIPSNAEINGIVVTIGRYSSGTTSPRIRDNVVSLIKGGVVTGSNKGATTTDWPTSTITAASYGTNSDLWGTTWTPADINANDFGVALSATNFNSSSRTAYVDYVQIAVTYTIPSSPEPPTVTTQAATNITGMTATGNGTITSLGAPFPSQHGVVWSTSLNPTIADSKTTDGPVSVTGAFTSSMTGLVPYTLYHVRAYATNDAGTSYGEDMTFMTTGVLPAVTTQAVTNIGQTTATGNGTVTSLGLPDPTEHGVCWATTANPTTANSHTSDGPVGATGAFTSAIAGLTPNTLYHVRAYATNTTGTSYGDDVQFTTSSSTVLTFTTSGSWTVPDGVTSVTVEVWGGGGRGASITSGYGEVGGGGGGGGAYSRSVVAVTPGTSDSYVVGAGSTGTTPGGDSYFINASTVMAKGGNSAGNNSSDGASGGAASSSVGTNRYSGGDGYYGSTSSNRGGGGGSSAGTSSDGNDGYRVDGGNAPASGGAGGDGRSDSSGTGYGGEVPGGAGGGAYRSSGSSTYTGGAGANGQVRITFYVSVGASSTSVNCGAGNPTVSYGSSITCVATVTAAGGISPTGTVSWTSTLGSGNFTGSPCTLSGTGGSAACQVDYTPTSIGPGSHLITASYSGDASFVASSGSQMVTVQTSQPVIYDDEDMGWTYSGWSGMPVVGTYANTLHYSNAVGSDAQLSFTGRQIQFTYVASPDSGSVDLFLDGVKVTTINQYNDYWDFQKTWTSDLLPATMHSLRVVHASGTFTTIDAVTVLSVPVILTEGVYDDTQTAIRYEGRWFALTGVSDPYGDTLRYSTTAGNDVQVNFSGRQIKFSYLASPISGSVDLYLDGVKLKSLDQHSLYWEWRKTWVSDLLPAGDHSLRIVQTSAGLGAVDALTVMTNPAALTDGVYDDANAAFGYEGIWFTLTGATGPYADTLYYSTIVGNDAQVSFTGRQVKFSYLASPISGSVTVYVDGVEVTTLDQHSPNWDWQKTWTSDLLAAGDHSLRIVHTSGEVASVDAIRVVGTPQILTAGVYDEAHAAFSYEGRWLTLEGVSGPYAGTLHYTYGLGEAVQVSFSGQQIKLTYLTAPTAGTMDVYIDGVKVATLDQRSEVWNWLVTWTSEVLAAGDHSLRLVHTTEGSSSLGNLDALTVMP